MVEYSNSTFPWLLAVQTMNDAGKSAKKLKYAAVLGNFLNKEGTFTVVK